MRNPALLSLLLASALASCQGTPGDAASRPALPPAPSPPGGGPAGETGSTLAIADGAGRSAPFALGSLTRLALRAAYRGTPGAHAVRIDVVGPGGTLYAQLRGDLLADPAGLGTMTRSMEVRGTPIESFHMIGTWNFVLNVDGTPQASASVSLVD